MNIRRTGPALLAAGLAIGTSAGLVSLSAATAGAATSSARYVCSGTAKSPGLLAGTYSSVVVRGVCAVNGGPAVVTGHVTI